MLEDPQIISTSKISIFFEKKNLKIALLGLGRYQKEQRHERVPQFVTLFVTGFIFVGSLDFLKNPVTEIIGKNNEA